ncbi:FAD-dependent monooxygenase [Bradyrhizobium sp. 156]|uniref:FAD-dependent oxidoreductase n=1 Tax=Bradyrhizobium sp. 156 TaxID=2782630 RepID=UPI001FFAAAE8|nr:FAD-dependent monooxygenase [Bradyrhizobium sp. 156]MCK1323537.1 FAD-dependent monooxygenase [Bradyrhizobium sp. 156]
MQSYTDVLVAGAGPTGLAAALFLASRNCGVRIIDKLEKPAPNSRAQVINPRSLELLEPSGVTAMLLEAGRPFRGVRFYDGWSDLAELAFDDIHPRFPMLALPQAHTEAILTEAVTSLGIDVERGRELVTFAQTDDAVQADIRSGAGHEDIEARLLLAADGSHSATRERLGLGFEGSSYPEIWPLYDIELDTPLDTEHAHVSFVHGGLVFFLAIGSGTWRVFGNVPEPLQFLPKGSRAGEVSWQSDFHVSHRIVERESVGRIVLAGDAAHIHSPVAARGMNLGIEDAAAFADAAARTLNGQADAIETYARARHAIHKSVVARIERLTFAGRGRPDFVGVLRQFVLPAMVHVRPIAHMMLDLVTGLDHPAPPMPRPEAVTGKS